MHSPFLPIQAGPAYRTSTGITDLAVVDKLNEPHRKDRTRGFV